jgi:hypothetical protein
MTYQRDSNPNRPPRHAPDRSSRPGASFAALATPTPTTPLAPELSLFQHKQREIAIMSSKHSELHQALQQVAKAEQRVAEQKVRIAQLQRLGCYAEISRNILRQMEDALRRVKNNRDLVLKSMMDDAA